jgi:hypothetical protein
LVTTPFLVCSGLASSRRQDNADNKAIEGKCFSEDENENHSNKKFWLLCIGSAKQTHLLKGGHKLTETTMRFAKSVYVYFTIRSNPTKTSSKGTQKF